MPKPKLTCRRIRTQLSGDPNFCTHDGRCSCRKSLRIIIDTPVKWPAAKAQAFLKKLEDLVDKED